MRANTTFLEPVINAHIAKLDVIPYAKAIRLVLPNSRRYIKCVWHNVMNMHSRKRSPAKCQSIAQRNNELQLAKAKLKAEADKAAADANAAGQIQTNLRAKEIKEAEADAEIAKQKKMVDLAAQEAEVQQRKLDAEVRKAAKQKNTKPNALLRLRNLQSSRKPKVLPL